VTLDEDVLDRVRQESRSRGASFKTTLNDLLRVALAEKPKARRRPFKVKPMSLGCRPDLNFDKIEQLIEYAEGPWHR
jgi:hypothetical protein